MSMLPQELLSAALRVKWESGRSEDERAIELLAGRIAGFSPEQYAEASRRAASLDRMAFRLAADWFASRGRGEYPRAEALQARHPGFATADYQEAVKNNIIWARK